MCLLALLAAAAAVGQEAESLYASGRRAFEDGLFLMASRSLHQLAMRYPDHPLADDAEYLEGLSEYYQQQYPRLIAIFKDFRRRHPQSPFASQVAFWMGTASFQLGQYPEAVAQLKAQADGFPGEKEYTDRALLLLGASLERLDDWGEAGKAYRRLLDRGAGGLEAEAWFRLGSCQLVLKDYPAALSSFTRVLVNHADSPQAGEALFYAAESLYLAGRYAEAERRYRLVLEGQPAPERVETSLYRLTRILARLNRPAEALAACAELERRFPSGPYAGEYALLSAEALSDLGRFKEAQAQYRKALDTAPAPADRQRLSYNLALAALSAGEPAAALEPLRASLAGGDRGIEEQALFRLAAALTELGREQEALRAVVDFRARFAGSDLSEPAVALEGSLLDRAGRSQEAREVFTQLLARYPFSARKDEYLFKRGASCLAAGDQPGALKDFFAVVQGRPGSAYLDESRYNIGFVYSQRGEFARAMPYFAEVIQRGGPLAGRSALASGVCLFNAGDYAGALAWFQRLPGMSAAQSSQAEGWYYSGRALYKLERLSEAEGLFARAASALAGTPEGEDSLYWRAVSLFRLNRLEAARQGFLDLAGSYPQGARAAEALYRAGMCEALLGNHAAGLALFERALAAARQGRAEGAREAGTAAEAAAGREAAGARLELVSEILFQQGLSLLASAKRDQAAEVFRGLGREFPGSGLAADGYLALAEADLRAGADAEALAGFRKLIKDYPRRPAGQKAEYWAGVASARQGLAEEALAHFLRYIELDPGGGLASSAEGEIRRLLADTADPSDRVLRDFLRRVEAAKVPGELKQKARFEYARYVFARDREQGLELLSALRAEQPAEPLAGEVYYLIGEGYRLRGELPRAADILTAVAASRADRTGALAQSGVARVREQQGRLEESAEEYLKVYFLFPGVKDLAAEGLYQASRLFREGGQRERADKLSATLRAEYPDSPRAGQK